MYSENILKIPKYTIFYKHISQKTTMNIFDKRIPATADYPNYPNDSPLFFML